MSKRDQIIETTCELMEMQGYHATGINQILDESGAPKGSLYSYFPEGKEGLAVEAIERSSRAISERIRGVMAESSDAASGVQAFFERLAGLVEASDYRHGGPITAIALEAASTNERLREACRDAYRRWQNAFGEKLRQELGDAQAQMLAAMVVSTLEGAIILSRSERSVKPLRDGGEALARLIRCY